MNEFKIIILAIIGLYISYLIWNSKNKRKKLYCIIGEDCNKVIKSKYSITLGIKNEIIGMLYYTLLILSSIIFISYPELLKFNLIILGRIIISGLSALFTGYLVFRQIFTLKEYCDYCLVASAINIIIFFVMIV